MSAAAPVATAERLKLDYSLTGLDSKLAVEKGLAEADWYRCAVPRETMRRLLVRRDGPALWNTAVWFALIFTTAFATYRLWGSGWAVLPYVVYSALYASTSDSRWHESGHGTAFKTDWMNNALYEIASFMVMRESTVWRWSHTRHHSDTIIVGRDPEISVPRPAEVKLVLLKFLGVLSYRQYFKRIVLHAIGIIAADEKTYIPSAEFPKIVRNARIYVAIYAGVLALSITSRSFLPIMLIGATNFFGSWLMVVYGLTQHAGLAENVLDHRLNCRTVYMNPIHRFLYWNMNYHVEHHMFPLVPFHALPTLHEAIKDDCPAPYPSLLAAWKEIIPAVLRQVKDPTYHVKRRLPDPRPVSGLCIHSFSRTTEVEGWVDAGEANGLKPADVARFDHAGKTYAICRDEDGKLYATDGICTHGNVHLSDGLVKGGIIECPKHNGRFNLIDGSPARVPACRGLATYQVKEVGGLIRINVAKPGGSGARAPKTYHLRVVSNRNVATFIKELVLMPVESGQSIAFTPGDYLQLDIPAYEPIPFKEFDIPEPFASVWRAQHLFEITAPANALPKRNNYSLASNRASEQELRFNVRIATPPPGQDCAPGVGSSYIFNLKPGDLVTSIGPFGDFHIKPTQREMVYLGGGAGMAPLRAHLSHLLETEQTARKISFWYGARSRQELFYSEYFQGLQGSRKNFSFHPALSSPFPEDKWLGPKGFIHDVVLEQYLLSHPSPAAVEYYLCGPPMMIKACTRMLGEIGVPTERIAYDAF